jgi:hypothetical protein
VKRIVIIVAAMLLPVSAQAKDFAVILNEQEKARLIQIIDEAIKAKGLALAGDAVFLASKIERAPEVEKQKSEPKKDEAK